jgi:hypothetical protein
MNNNISESIKGALLIISEDLVLRRSNAGQGARKGLTDCLMIVEINETMDDAMDMIIGNIFKISESTKKAMSRGTKEYLDAKIKAYRGVLSLLMNYQSSMEGGESV